MIALHLLAAAAAATVELGPGDDLPGILQSLSPGSELVLDDGVYEVPATLSLSVVGTSEAPVLIRAKNPGEAVLRVAPNTEGSYPGTILRLDLASFITLEGLVIEGDETWSSIEGPRYYGLVINESTDITVEDVEVRQVNYTAVYLAGNNSRITFDGLHVHDVNDGAGLYVGCSDASCWTRELIVERSYLHDVLVDDSGIVLAHGTQGAVIRDTVIHDTTSYGMVLGSTEQGTWNTIEGNAIWATVEAGIIIQGDALIRNNLIFGIQGRGLWTYDPGRGAWGDLVLSFNTIVDTTSWAAELDAWEQIGGTLVLANNALCNPIGYGVQLQLSEADTALSPAPGLVSTNMVCGLVEGVGEVEEEILSGGGYADFMDPEGWDFYPQRESALIDAADASGEVWVPEIDFNGAARPGDLPDVGAYEWNGDGNPGWKVQEGFKTFTLTERQTAVPVGGCCQDKGDEGTAAALLLPFFGLGALRRRKR